MKYYSQKDPRWANNNLGFCKGKFEIIACYLTSISMLTEIEPPELNRRIKVAGGYSNGCMINSQIVAKELKTFYNRTKDNPKVDYPIIAETDHYKRVGFKQHFFVLLPDGRRVDPLDFNPKPEYNNYNIVSYRDFHITSKKTMSKKKDITKEIKKASKKYLKVDFGKRISSAEDKKAAKAIKTLYNSVESLMKEQSKILLKSKRDEAEEQMKLYKTKYDAVVRENEILNETKTNQAKEITRLKAVNEKNAENSAVVDALIFVYKVIKARIKK